jgi:hypothetical protein
MKWTLLILSLMCTGCVNTVIPPSEVQVPVSVFLVDYDKHSSLVMPISESEVIEYAYGEWEWFAQGNAQWYRVFPAMLWPTAGALGRRTESVRPTLREVRYRFPAEAVYELAVERALLNELLSDLDERHARDAGPSVTGPWFGLTFSRDDESYHGFHNCNHETCEWLEQLGCEVLGSGMFSDWKVKSRLDEGSE